MGINQELINWINTAKSRGLNSQQIYKELIKNGYPPFVAKEAITSFDKPTKKPSNKKFIFYGLAIVVIIIGIFFIANIGISEKKVDNSQFNETKLNNLEEIELIQEEPQPVQEEIIDCGQSTMAVNDCFLNAAKSCNPVKVIVESEVDMFGMIMSAKTLKEIKGMENKKCIFYDKYLNNTVSFSEEFVQMGIENGATQEEIDQQLIISNQDAQKVIGKESFCKYTIEDLIQKLQDEMKGSFSWSSEDKEKYECAGSFYEVGQL